MSLPYDIYKVKLILKRKDSKDPIPYYEYEVTSPHNGYNAGDRLVLDNDLKSIIEIKRHMAKPKTPVQKYARNTLNNNTQKSSLLSLPITLRPTTQLKTLTNINKTLNPSIRPKLKVSRKNRRKYISRRSKSTTNQTFIPKNDLDFINQYILAYQNKETDSTRYNAFNKALSKNPNKKLLWKGIWRGIDPNNTSERNAAQHELLYTIHPGKWNEMGQMNWYNMFNGNLLHATADDLSIPRSSLDYISPELRAKTMQLTTSLNYVVQPSNVANSNNVTQLSNVTNSNNIDELIRQNANLFKSQYEYAKLHNGTFDYIPSSFDTSNLNVNYKYGGIGDFMDTYGLSPDLLYSALEKVFVSKKQYGGILIKKFLSGDKLILNSINTLGMWNSGVTGLPYDGYVYTPESNAYVYKRQKVHVIEKPSLIKFSDFPLSVLAKTLWDYMMHKLGLNPSWNDNSYSSEKLLKLSGYDRKLPKRSKSKQQKK